MRTPLIRTLGRSGLKVSAVGMGCWAIGGPFWSGDNAVGWGKLEAIREILTSNGRTLAQGALAWIWGRTEQTIPIPGFKTVQQVEQNAGTMQFGPLTPDQMQEIKRLLER